MGADRRSLFAAVALLGVAEVALVVGWRALWFLCDDAYIAFRYVDHAVRGWGLVWNPAPFRPVEGYTSFLWVRLLEVIWRVTGVEPPVSSPLVGLACGAVTLAVTAVWVWRVPWSERFLPWRLALLALVLASVVSNRTFLAWNSSGLETAMVTTWIVAWAGLGLLGPIASDRRLLSAWVALAALLALTRPDGYLFCAASAAVVVGMAWREWRFAVALLPLLLPVLHVAWRRSFYGYWVPNTYAAKQVAPWPDAGISYVAAFLLEYAYWVWLVVAWFGVVALVRWGRGGGRPDRLGAARAVVALTLLAQVLFYVLLVGGDHFEFRIFQHLVPVLAVTLPWMADRLGWTPARAAGALAVMTGIGLAIPWTHFALTDGLDGRDETRKLRYAVAPSFPWVVRWYPLAWDALEAHLIGHMVGVRQPTHRNFWRQQLREFPSREVGLALSAEEIPVFHETSVGVPGWTMPTIALIDDLGLNDLVIARSPPRSAEPGRRNMAHDRIPPKGYVGCFQPNVSVSKQGVVTVRRRAKPMTAAIITACEEEWLSRAIETPR